VTASFVATSTPVISSVAAVTATLPTGTASGDIVYLTAVTKPATATIATPTGWTLVNTQSLGTGTEGAGTGPVRISVFSRVYDGAWTMPAVSNGGTAPTNVVSATSFRPGAGEAFVAETTTQGSDTSLGTGFSVTGAANLSVTTGDMILAVTGITGNTTATTPTLTATGATLGSLTEQADAGNANGNRAAIKVHTAVVTAGTSTAAPVHGMTLALTSTGGVVFVRVRTAVATPKIETFTDDFAILDTNKWFVNANASAVNGQANFSISTAYQGIYSKTAYDLTGSQIFLQLVQPPNQGLGTNSLYWYLDIDGANQLLFIWEGGTLYAGRKIGGTSTYAASRAYDPANDKWLRISESGGTVTWSVSADGTTWSTFGTWVASGLPLTQFWLSIGTGYYGAETAPGTAIIDNLNTAPSGTPYTASPDDPAAAVDAVTVLRNEVNFPADTAGAVDAVAVTQGENTFPGDSAGATDSVAVTQGENTFPGDAAAATDSVSALLIPPYTLPKHSSSPPFVVATTGTVTTAAFTPPTGALLLAMSVFNTATTTRLEAMNTVTGSTSAWTPVIDQTISNGGIAVSSATVTASASTTVRTNWTDAVGTTIVSNSGLLVPVFAGGQVVNSGTLRATAGTTTVTVTRTQAGSRLYVMYVNFDASTKPVAAASLTEEAWTAVGYSAGIWTSSGDLAAGSNSFTLTGVPAAGVSGAPQMAWVEVAPGAVNYTPSLSDFAGVVDSVAIAQGENTFPGDSAGAVDAVSTVLAASSVAADVAGAVDAVSFVRTANVTATDAAAVTDAALVVQSLSAAPADVAGAVDAAASSQFTSSAPADAAAASDAVTLAVTRTAADTGGAVDATSVVQSLARTAADVAGGVDSGSGLMMPAVPTGITATPTATTAAISWTAVPGATTYDVIVTEVALNSLTWSGNDNGDAVDTASVTAALARSSADTAGAVDATTVVSTAARTVADTGGATDAVSVVLTTGRAPADAAAVTDAVTANLVRGELTLGVTWVQFDNPDTPAKRAVTQATVEVQNVHVNAFGSDLGYNATAGDTNWAGYNWAWLDTRIQTMRDASRTGGKLAITLYAPPQWMLGVAPNTWDFFGIPLPPARNADWASLCAYIAQRYPDVGYFQVWNEMKGYWNNTLNRWDYEGFTAMYNAVYNAVKAVRPDAQVGGPYLSFNVHTAGYQGASSTSTAAMDLGGTASSITGTGGPGYFFDGRDLDVYNYFRLNAAGVDFVCVDLGLLLDDGAVHPETVDRFAKLPQWVNARFPNKPIWFSEYYYGGGTTNFGLVRSQMDSTDLPVTALLWHAIAGEADLLFDTSGVRTPVGDAHATFLANKVGQPVLADTAGATDSVTAVITSARTAADTAGAVDSVSPTVTGTRTLADVAGATDAVSAATAYAPTVADSAGAVDAVTTVSSTFVTVTDSAGAVDATSLASTEPVADAAGATDAVTFTQAAQVTVVDAAGAVDAVSVNASGSLSATAADTAGAADAVSTAASSTRAVVDVAGAVDAVATAVGVQGAAADTAGTADAVSISQTGGLLPADVAAAVDAVSWTAAAAVTVADTAAVVDTATPVQSLARGAADTAGAVDSANAGLTLLLQGSGADVAGATDAITASMFRESSPADTAGASDAVTYTMVRVVFVDDTAGAVDMVAPQRNSSWLAADSAAAVDAAQGVLANAGLMSVRYRLRHGKVAGKLRLGSLTGRLLGD
jgi:cytochrome c-type biogenesis protein CcmE